MTLLASTSVFLVDYGITRMFANASFPCLVDDAQRIVEGDDGGRLPGGTPRTVLRDAFAAVAPGARQRVETAPAARREVRPTPTPPHVRVVRPTPTPPHVRV
eukprot:gene27520-62140_t